jgi:hypothetical protein
LITDRFVSTPTEAIDTITTTAVVNNITTTTTTIDRVQGQHINFQGGLIIPFLHFHVGYNNNEEVSKFLGNRQSGV